MRRFLKDNKASAWAWAVVLVGIFVLILCWGIFGPIIQTLYLYFTGTGEVLPQMQQPMDDLLEVWRWFPVIMAFGLFIYGIAYSVYHESGGH